MIDICCLGCKRSRVQIPAARPNSSKSYRDRTRINAVFGVQVESRYRRRFSPLALVGVRSQFKAPDFLEALLPAFARSIKGGFPPGPLRRPQESDHPRYRRNASREDRHKVKPDGPPSSKLKRYLVGRYAAIGPPILGLICYVYILMQGYAMNLPSRAK